MEWFILIQKGLIGGVAAVGFAVLFNVPNRSLLYIYLLGTMAVFTKFCLLAFDVNIILSTFSGAGIVGILSIFTSKRKHTPPMIFSIASVIPMIPGIYLYRMMLGFIRLVSDNYDSDFSSNLEFTITNGLNAGFILMALAMGISLPYIILKKATFHDIKNPA